jgi:hypothetical protein
VGQDWHCDTLNGHEMAKKKKKLAVRMRVVVELPRAKF